MQGGFTETSFLKTILVFQWILVVWRICRESEQEIIGGREQLLQSWPLQVGAELALALPATAFPSTGPSRDGVGVRGKILHFQRKRPGFGKPTWSVGVPRRSPQEMHVLLFPCPSHARVLLSAPRGSLWVADNYRLPFED